MPPSKLTQQQSASELLRLRRAEELLSYIDRMKAQEAATRRTLLAEHVAVQKAAIDRRSTVLEKRRVAREREEARARREGVRERRRYLEAISRIPDTVDESQPAHTTSSNQHHPPKAPPPVYTGSIQSIPLHHNPSRTVLTGLQTSSADVSLPRRSMTNLISEDRHLDGDAAVHHRAPTNPRRLASNAKSHPRRLHTRTLHKSAAYHAQAADMRMVRTEAGRKVLPPPSRQGIPADEVGNVSGDDASRPITTPSSKPFTPTTQSQKPSTADTGKQIWRRVQLRLLAAGQFQSPTATAPPKVFRTEAAFRRFKEKYNDPNLDKDIPDEETENSEEKAGPAGTRLASRVAMYTSATRNRKRTVAFVQSRGTTGGGVVGNLRSGEAAGRSGTPPPRNGGGKAKEPTALMSDTDLGVFALHLRTARTDRSSPPPNLDLIDTGESTTIPADDTTMEVDAFGVPVRAGGKRRGTMIAVTRQGGVDTRRDSVSVGRGGGRGTPDLNTGIAEVMLDTSGTVLTHEEALSAAVEQMGKGRRGMSASQQPTQARQSEYGKERGMSGTGDRGSGAGRERLRTAPTGDSAGANLNQQQQQQQRGESQVRASTAPPGSSAKQGDWRAGTKPASGNDLGVGLAEEDEGAHEDTVHETEESNTGDTVPYDPTTALPTTALTTHPSSPPPRRRPRVFKTWQPISFSAAAETKRVLMPKRLFELPASSCGEGEWTSTVMKGVTPVVVDKWRDDDTSKGGERIAVPKVMRFWSTAPGAAAAGAPVSHARS
ncbi:uncharacterized protein EV422DRAFT_510668 [Fimicolochytrium jonesii]|uniref:uncharacterized protein n=1 Tax=Fimicolochytrium jonesii TaxID=1396493 RepID=UPI0022FE53A6|nr:uncharacterized protein EV422DRAFT_510668 [Fimicolochytrium jonesii]KAI8826561.1 hypothetical protein EV422DRAFT_510668 [Fimicolochytrium jonesii]